MSIALMSLVFKRSRTRGNARVVLLALADSASDEGDCWPSIGKIAAKANLSPKVTKEYLAAFGVIGLLSKEPRHAPNGRQTSNIYRFHADAIGQDEITPAILNQARAKSRQTGGGGNPSNPLGGGGNPSNRGEGVTRRTPSFLNHQKEPLEKGASHEEEVVEEKEKKGKALFEEFKTYWNTKLGTLLPEIRLYSDKRVKAFTTRMMNPDWRTHWKEAIDKIPSCPFLIGENERKWKADAEFFLRPDTVAKIIEGKYDGPQEDPNDWWKKHY